MFIKVITIAGAILMLTACAAAVPEYDESLSMDDAAASVDIKQLFFEKLDYGEERREFFTLNLMHEFDEGKSVYRAFELPEYEHTYSITLRSRMFTRKGQRQLFLPIVDKLDADFRVTEKYEVSTRQAQTAVKNAIPIEFKLVIGEQDRYLVIHSPAKVFAEPVNPGASNSTVLFAKAGNLDIVMPLRGDNQSNNN